MPIDGYIRVSSTKGRGGDSFVSPKLQRETIERLAKARGLDLGEVVQELDVSGAKSIEERKLGQLVEKVERGESKGIILWKLSRFSRSLVDAVQVANRIEKADGLLLAEDYDSSQPMSKAILGFLAGWAEEQRDGLGVQWAAARRNAVDRGVAPYRTPLGYERDEDGRLVPNGDAKLVQKMFELRAAGGGVSEIARQLPGSWSHSTIAQILRNRTYLGEVAHGMFANDDAHPALVGHSLFDACQVIRPMPHRKGDPRSLETLLAGLVYCAGCGHTLKVVQGYGGRLRYYCKGPYKSGLCPARCLVRADELDPYVERLFLKFVHGRLHTPTARAEHKELREVEVACEKAQADLDGFLTLSDAIEPKDFQKGYEARKARLEQARTRLAELRTRAGTLDGLSGLHLLDHWQQLGMIQKRRLLASWVDRILVSKGNGLLSKRVRLGSRAALVAAA